MFKDRAAFLPGINTYVPGMQYASALVHGQPTDFSLGSPAAESASLLVNAGNAQAAANTDIVIGSTLQLQDSAYGRNLRLSISGNPGNANVIDVYGFDYLGQPMVERFTGASGATAILYGRKAFKRVSRARVVTPSTNAVTFNLGTGSKLGLPFKGDLVQAREAGVQTQLFNRDQIFYMDRSAAEAVSGGSRKIIAPFPGYVKGINGVANGGGGTTDPVITVSIGGVAITGLTETIDTSDTTGAVVTGVPTTPGYNANNRFKTGDVITVVAAAAAGAFGDRLGIILTPTQFSTPDLTDPQTAVTGDPRGTYEALRVLDGSEVIVSMIGNPQVNAAGNGGLMGLRHFGG